MTPGPRARRGAEIAGVVFAVLAALLLAAIVLGALTWLAVVLWSAALA